MRKLWIFGVCCLLLVGCSTNQKTTKKTELLVGGSTSIQPLMEKLAEDYMKQNEMKVSVQGGGSSMGVKGANEGVLDIGMVSRELKDDEKEELDEQVIALDGIVVIVNQANTIQNITLEQLHEIYTGKITNWKQLGGKDAIISVVSREEGSGTRDGFESIVGFESSELIQNADIQNATGGVISTVSTNNNAIGFISMGSVSDQVDVLRVNDITPSVETITNGSYVLQRPLILVTKKENHDAQEFYDFIFSKTGKEVIEKLHYIPVNQ
ncbi:MULTISPECIES: phosphate ABC transporter substrate-binding protein [unclassified Breznakia]|uniref:phosphate ABC transporter substrate-binding protein n=1 Tax=unclassified Breznakia TaxID=2623764 RepID=UPI002473B422|nr:MULTISPECIES: phosphate ABC transporter substrate-binding protein [unclassified Breznakia]MDH6366521.1 phosphate transport system substrate-binding protein [Breznakia sp. PH1-1]MDH6403614.1 phosphate transport system substrate-binding protein [Breznakia sp. PF1-11]MDH6411323.1 phosphate transport system substrate-binding protein [Breznakia sp. PFB1-11]MDH6413701.1 phosphate transport system substrate-binding protein [Breznakia sp. PFB1-14]MDH6415868.1 phosphate transport system substrate-bi